MINCILSYSSYSFEDESTHHSFDYGFVEYCRDKFVFASRVRVICLCRRQSHEENGGGETSLPCLDRSARSDRSKRAGDAGWYRPFGFADGQLREALVASILTINMGGFAWQRQV